MIPKIIHYCWFGRNPLPELAKRCIASWRKYLPDYEIREWNEENFDVNIIPFTEDAYKQKKYAFVSDYARFWILYKYGGVYFDTDVEVICPMDDIIGRGNFMGFEVDPDGDNLPGRYAPRYCFCVNPGIGFGISKEHPFMKEMLEKYKPMVFQTPTPPWGKTVVAYTTEALMKDGLRSIKGIQQVGDITIYPHEFFAPINVISNKLHITPNTHAIHWYMGSWSEKGDKNIDKNKRNSVDSFKRMMTDALPEWVFFIYNRIIRRRYRIK